MSIRTFALATFVMTCAVSIGLADGPGEIDVPLTIQDWAGVDRRADIVSTGIPMPYGVLADADLAKIAVFAPDSRPVPAQFRILERWREFGQDDKSIKWLLVTFLVDLEAGQKATYRLKAGTNPAPTESAKPFDGQGVTLKLTLPDGKVIAQDLGGMKPSGTWEEGPIRACVKWETPSTREGDGFGCMVWAYTYAGLRRVDLTVVLKNTPNELQGPLMFRNFSVEYTAASINGARDFLLGGQWGEPIAGAVADTAYLYQSSDGTDSWDTQSRRLKHWRDGQWQATTPWSHAYTLSYASYVKDGQQVKVAPLGRPEFRGFKAYNRGEQIAAGNFAQGYVALCGKQTSGLMLVRDFLRQYPKAVEVRPGTLVARLWPKFYEAHNGLHWLDDLQRKAHDVSFQFVDGKLSVEAAEAAARAFDHPLIIHCGTDWYRQTGACGYVAPRFEEKDIEVQPELISDGSSWVTFGGDLLDRIRRRYHHAPMGPFVRHGWPDDANNVRVAMRHSTGVTPMWPDDYRYPRDADMLKIAYCGPARGRGDYIPGTAHHGYMPWNNQHWLCDEIPDGWRLFGDPLSYDALEDMATYIRFYFDRRNSGQEGINETRVDAMPMVVISDCYRILGDEALLAAIGEFVNTTCRRQVNKQRGYYGPNKSVTPEAGGADKPFMISTLLDGLREYHNLSGDETAHDLMLGMTDFCIEEAFLNDRLGFRYTIPVDLETSRRTLTDERKKAETAHQGGYRAWQMFRPLAWAYLHTGDERYREVFIQMCKAAKDATVWRHPGSPNPDSSDWGCICDQIRDLPDTAKPDAVPPAPITDLQARALGGGEVRLMWTTPRDASRLRIKYADKPMVRRLNLPGQADTHVNWWAAENVSGEPTPEPGKPQTMIVEGVAAGTRVFAIRTFDSAGNRSKICNDAVVRVE